MELFHRTAALLKQAVEDGAAPCAALAIGVRDRPLFRMVIGNARTVGGREAAGPRTRYDMASLTKILSPTMIALRMIEEGRLHLYNTIGDILDAGAERAEVTVFQLMTHTGGFLPDIPLERYAAGPGDAVRAILASPPACAPGEEVHYSCLGYILLGRMLERLGGLPLDELARQYVFRPLGMERTGYLPAGGDIAATEVTPEGECLCGTVHDENARFLGGVSGNAGVFSDLDDMEAFASMLACGGRRRGVDFLAPCTLRAATRCYTPGMTQNRGLGFHLSGPGSFHGDLFPPSSYGHTGFTGTSLLVDPESGLYVVLLSNRVHPTRENTRFLHTRRAVHNAAMAEFSRLSAQIQGGGLSR